MNNLLKVFKITVAGTKVDNKMYNQYDDYDSSSVTTAPTDLETTNKGIAYLRYQLITRLLSEYSVPVYCNVEFGTVGTAKTIPTDASIVVGWYSLNPFLSTLTEEEQKALVTDEDKELAAADVIETMLNTALVGDNVNALVKEMITVQKTVNRNNNAYSNTEVSYVESETVYLDVPAVATATAVVFVQL